MPRRRLILPAGLAAGLILHGLSGPRRARSVAAVCADCPTARQLPPSAQRTADWQPRSRQATGPQVAGAAAADFARGVHDNGRRSRIATPGGRNERRLEPRPDGPGRMDGRAAGPG